MTKSNTANIRIAFFFGTRRDNPEDLLKSEQQTFNDLVVQDYVHDYQNLTLKTVASFQWAVRNCGQARFMIKSDDDMWRNMHFMMGTLNKEEALLQTSVDGYCRSNGKPVRNLHSKWHASVKFFPQDKYPTHCYRTSYATSMNMVRTMVDISPKVPFFHLEDVCIALCVTRHGEGYLSRSVSGFLHGKQEPNCVLLSSKTLTVHQVEPPQMYELWTSKCP